MKIFLIGLIWIVMSAMLARQGFFNYCVMRSISDKTKDPEQIYLAAKPKLLTISWLNWTLFTMALVCAGFWLMSSDEPVFHSEEVGIVLLLCGLGLLTGFHIFRAGQIWNDVS